MKKDVIQYDGIPGKKLYYARPDKGDEQVFLYNDKKLQQNYRTDRGTMMLRIRDIYGITKYPGKGVYKSEKVVGQVDESMIRESNNNLTSKREGLPRGKRPYLKTEGIDENPPSWVAKVNYWRKKIESMIGYEVLE